MSTKWSWNIMFLFSGTDIMVTGSEWPSVGDYPPLELIRKKFPPSIPKICIAFTRTGLAAAVVCSMVWKHHWVLQMKTVLEFGHPHVPWVYLQLVVMQLTDVKGARGSCGGLWFTVALKDNFLLCNSLTRTDISSSELLQKTQELKKSSNWETACWSPLRILSTAWNAADLAGYQVWSEVRNDLYSFIAHSRSNVTFLWLLTPRDRLATHSHHTDLSPY